MKPETRTTTKKEIAFQKWVPLKIIDEATAPKSAALVRAYRHAFEAGYDAGADAGRDSQPKNDHDYYASYANHCAIQKQIPLTIHSWRRAGNLKTPDDAGRDSSPSQESFVIELAGIYGLSENFLRALPNPTLEVWKMLVREEARRHKSERETMEKFRQELIQLKFAQPASPSQEWIKECAEEIESALFDVADWDGFEKSPGGVTKKVAEIIAAHAPAPPKEHV